MKRTILSFLLAIISVSASFAATERFMPDRSQITAAVSDQNSYKALADRFASGQKLTVPEVAAIYYGTALQPGFNPSQSYPDIARTYAAGDYATTLSLIWSALSKDPANLYLLFTGYGSAASLGNQEAASLLQNRLLQICDLIFSTGTGITQDSPYIVVRPSDIDEFLIKYIQPQKIDGRAKIGNLDACRVQLEGIDNDIIMYFSAF